MLVNLSALVLTLATASAAPLGRRAEPSVSWSDLEQGQCHSSKTSADLRTVDVPELISALKGQSGSVTIPAGSTSANTRFYFCRSAGLILGNTGDEDKDLNLAEFASKLEAASDELTCETKKELTKYWEMTSKDDDAVTVDVWLRGPNVNDGNYWDTSSAESTAGERVVNLCPEGYKKGTRSLSEEELISLA